MEKGQILLTERARPANAELGATGRVKLLELQVNGIIQTRMRHVIKRYLKRVGFRDLKVEHVSDSSPFTLRLVAHGHASTPVTEEQMNKLRFLHDSLVDVLTYTRAGYVPHASKADPELLRQMLAKVEPSLNKIYYTIA
jgi:hypothetical protein